LLLNILLLLFSYCVIIFSKKIFLIWLGLELTVFLTIPLFSIILKKTVFRNLSSGFLYYFFSMVGSLLMLFSFLSKLQIFLFLGLLIKLGIFPLLIWVPTVLFNLKWLKLFFVLILKKLPLFYLLYTLFSKNNCTWIFVIRIILGIFGLFSSSKNFKLFFCWSSVVKSGFISIIFLKNPFWGWVFYFIYLILGLFICFLKYLKKSDKIFFSKPKPKIFLLKVFLLILAGFPPFFGFLKKVFFFLNLLKY